MSELSPMADRMLEATIEQGEPIRVRHRLNGSRVDVGEMEFAPGDRRELVIAKAAIGELCDAGLIRGHVHRGWRALGQVRSEPLAASGHPAAGGARLWQDSVSRCWP